jgi:steroid delta-isomerase-like uncharacterized protein
MSTESNKTVVRRVFDEVFNQGNVAVIDEIFAAGYVDHSAPPGFPPGLESLKLSVTVFRTAFPDLQIRVEDLIAEGDKVVARLTYQGTHLGDFMGIPPSRKQLTEAGIAIDTVKDGRIVEHWVVRDDLGLLQQLGMIPNM